MQYKTHTVRSILVTILVVLILTASIIWMSVIFKKEPYSLNVKRSFILAEVNKEEPKTLEELLHCDAPDIDTILKSPSIINELKEADSLLDIVDSRLAINNLRNIDRQFSERIDLLSNASDDTLCFLDGNSQSGEQLSQMRKHIQGQIDLITDLKTITGSLLVAKEYDELISIPLNVNMKGIWQSPDEVFIHMVPSGDWLPEKGYKIYRIVNGQKQLIAENHASHKSSLAGGLKVIDKDIIQKLYGDAELTEDKLAKLGMSAENFRIIAYRTDSLAQKPRVSAS